MTESALTVLSVRGDSRLEVGPDLATLDCSLVVYEREKAAALSLAAQRLDALLADVAALGGVVRTADADRVRLCWLARSARSYPEFDHEKGYRRQTGRVIANVSVRMEVRDFALLNRLDATLARHPDLHVNGVRWSVDHDN
ncbi:MAG TPA: SIMPL domain-containing protein, partial [Jatrophihabitantaceae bacterium]|nr:SIMPL domain-containing protein [Jatrophihabitantaceae bacterium]